jgi:hypothetical protein
MNIISRILYWGNEMSKSREAKVPYVVSNIERCMCPRCPVQADSVCTLEKIGNLKSEIKSLGEGEAPEPQKVPGVYCSAGTATCNDLDPNRDCICKTCPVWEEHRLEQASPMMYFCNIGRAS